MDSVKYASLKAAATAIRSASATGPPNPEPDAVIHIPSRDAERTIKVHIYKPATPQTPSPVLINLHGSGFILPLHGSDDVFCRRIASETGHVVLDVQYRLAPEDPFPAAPHDTEDALRYVLARPEEYEASKVSVSGFSAGGNLVIGASTLFPDKIRSLLAIYAPTDLAKDPNTKVQADPSGPNKIPAALASLFNECYISEEDAKNPLVSPALGDNAFLETLPKNILIVTCAYDTLALETEEFADRIEKLKSKNLARKRVLGVGHAWDKGTIPGSEEEEKRDEVYALCVQMLKD